MGSHNGSQRAGGAAGPTARDIFALALPALGVLAAMPLYLLLDTAVVGRLGAESLAALGAAAVVQSVVTTQLTFLSYGTTARAAHHFGAGRRQRAIAEGVQATWVALGVGVFLMLAMLLAADPIARAMTSSANVAAQTSAWLRVASPSIVFSLLVMAGNGWMRGLQDTRTPLRFTLRGLAPGAVCVPVFVHFFGVVGSAAANVVGMGLIAAQFVWELRRQHTGSWAPEGAVIWKQLVLGRDLIIRSLAFQVALLSAATVAGRSGTAVLAGHQVLTQLWNFLTLTLDSLAIAAQAIIGAGLGAGSVDYARRAGQKIMGYSAAFALGLAAVFAAGAGLIPRLFTADAAVLAQMAGPWWVMVGMVIAGGVLFALDGVLLGAGDAAFLRTLTVGAVAAGYLPGVWMAHSNGWGLLGVWAGLAAFIGIRTVGVVWRFYSMRWATVELG
ncbi:MATE family efflux transporter [Corynebacterium lizhenjunii]|nr:MATE family efflux transporter [Corynebacterium lizhenjunii]